ncbi:hypothetical protein BMAGN_1512 [Bifidobacterium magnum]|uniref:Uncharacterized protein n=1 Tax=Bifidobacterium magnum TaxID=1692 RepID=A0A087B9V8_9BIFI|nr:hypothetical protein BMAGN_1512 [Bifidobacterium magnum]
MPCVTKGGVVDLGSPLRPYPHSGYLRVSARSECYVPATAIREEQDAP